MGFMRALYISVTIVIVPTLVCLILSVDLWTALHIGCICVAVFGIFVGAVGAYKTHSIWNHLRSETYEDALDDDAFIVMLVKDVDHTIRTLQIVEGEENIELYNDVRVRDAFERAVERGVKIRFVLKPSLNNEVI